MDDDAWRLMWRAAEDVRDALVMVPREVQASEIDGLLQRHLRVRAIATRAFDGARARHRTARGRGSPPILNAGEVWKRSLARVIPDGVAELVASTFASQLSRLELRGALLEPQASGDKRAAVIVACLEIMAEHAAGCDLTGEIFAMAHRVAERALRRGFAARACAHAAVLVPLMHFETFNGDGALLDVRWMSADFPLYMVATQGTKENAPQRLAAMALALLGFGNADIYTLILNARRAIDPTHSVDRAQIRRLTAPVRARSPQRPTVRA